MSRADVNAIANQDKILAWLGAPAQDDLIATTAEITIAVSMPRDTVWPACEALEKLGRIEWHSGRRDGDRPGGWSSTRSGRDSVKATHR